MSNPYEPFTINTLANHNKLNAFTKILAVPTVPWMGNNNFCTCVIDHEPKVNVCKVVLYILRIIMAY